MTDLLPSVYSRQIFNIDLIIVDRYIKFAKYIPACKDWKVKKIANVLVEKVFTKYSKLVFFKNNYNLLFMSKF